MGLLFFSWIKPVRQNFKSCLFHYDWRAHGPATYLGTDTDGDKTNQILNQPQTPDHSCCCCVTRSYMLCVWFRVGAPGWSACGFGRVTLHQLIDWHLCLQRGWVYLGLCLILPPVTVVLAVLFSLIHFLFAFLPPVSNISAVVLI